MNERARALEELVARRVDRSLPSKAEAALVVGVYDDGSEAVVGRGRALPDQAVAPDGRTVFLIGSVTKAFTGLLFADALNRGVVTADAPAQTYLPGVVVPAREGQSPTLMHLATYTSGLPHSFENWQPAREEFLRELAAYRLPQAPGEKFIYGNVGYALLGEALANAQHTTFGDLLRTRVLAPLGMTQTGLVGPGRDRTRAQGYDEEWKPMPAKAHPLAGCCALESNMDDLMRLVRAWFGQAPPEVAAALKRAAEPVLQGSGAFDDRLVGLGWFSMLPDGVIGKDGIMYGYRATVVIDRVHRRGVVVLANQRAVDVDQIARHVLHDLRRRDQPGVPTVSALPASATPADIEFEEGVRLVGYDAPPTVRRGESARVTLYFSSERAMADDYRVFVHGDAAGMRHRLHGDHDPPGTTAAGSSDSWPLGRIVVDTFELPIPRDTDVGERRLYVGLYSSTRRLHIRGGCSDHDRACGATLRVE